MSRSRERPAGFVADGAERDRESARYATEVERIRREVREEFSNALASAGWIRRLLLRMQLRREIGKRVEELSPSSALYGVNRE